MEKFPDALITIPTEQQFLLAANGQALMTDRSQYLELISLAKKNYPETSFDFLSKSIYSDPLNGEEQRACIQLIRFARALQDENPFFEPIYHQLLHLYVLNGSRLDLLSRLDRRIRGLAAGQSSLALISGYSGIGKTSLVLALQERIAHLGADFVVARCSEQESMPYQLWRDIAVAAAAKNGASLNTLPAPIGDGRAANSVHQLTQALSAWLGNSTAPRPLVVLLDDLHWADIDSLEMLNKLTGHDQKPQMVFLGTYRSEERSRGHPFYDYWPKLQRNRLFDHLHLKPLTLEDVQRLVTSYHGPSSKQLAAYLFDRAEGHPLFTIELLNNLIEQNLLTQDDNGKWFPPEASVPVPIVLRQLINRRVLRLGPDVDRLLSTASVAGESWPLQIIEPLLDLPEERLLIALEQALAADLITIEGDSAEIYRFSHGLIKQVLYENQLARRRKQMHKKIAAQFKKQQGSTIYLTAFHYYEADAWKEAFHACTEAGKQAANSFANNRALDLYQKALDAAQRAAEEITPQQLLDAYEILGQTYQVLDRQREAELTYSHMRDSARSVGNLTGEVRALVHLTMVRIAIYELNLAERTAHEALKIGEQIEDPGLKAQIHGSLAKLLVAIGKLDAFNFHINQMQQYMTEMDPASLSNAFRQQTYEAIFTGRYEEAEEFGRQSLAYAQSTAIPLYVAGGYQVLSFTQIESGKYVQAYENMSSILDFSEIADPYYHQLSRLLNQMGYLYLELGDAAQALSWDRRAIVAGCSSPGTSNFEMQRYSLLNLATDYLHLDRIDEALDALAQFEAIKEAPDYAYYRYHNRYLLVLGELHLAQNLLAEAIDFAREARDFARANKGPKNIAKSYWLEGQALMGMNNYSEAILLLEEAVSIVDAISHGSLRWKIRLSLAQVLNAAGKSSEAPIQKARALIDQTTETLSGSQLQQSFLSSPWIAQITALEQPAPPKKTIYPAGLTTREVEVLRLVAGGSTNQQVADSLHISVRTVNTHMANILNKTGCDNRTAASAFAIQHNLLTT
jgi:DNA-binding CsgD family transcriptional regulator/tetratricopeptide (TPR) repeat protein